MVFVAFFVVYAMSTGGNDNTFIFVNGEYVSFDTYNINGFRYFKLNDLAYALSGTTKQFDISWDDENNAIFLTSGSPYTFAGGEIASVSAILFPSAPSTPRIYLDDNEVQLSVHNIRDSSYIMLRDIAEVIDFYVNWDHNRITIDTGKSFEDSIIAYNVRSVMLRRFLGIISENPLVVTSRSEIPDELLEMYANDFFTNNYLVIVSSGSGSSSEPNYVESLNVDGEIVLRGHFLLATMDMISFYQIIELNNAFLPAEFSVILNDTHGRH